MSESSTSTTTQSSEKLVTNNRNRLIIRTSIHIIIANLMLALMKAVIGLLTNSIAIVLDAINNFTDAGSSLITIIGTKLASKKPDREHPWGHGRIEYISSMIIGAIITSAGLSSLIESSHKILSPQTPDYNMTSLIIIGICVLVKIVLGRYASHIGQKCNSETLINSGKDALLDAVISTSTLIAAIIFIFYNISLEAYLAAIISIIIIKAGFDMIRNTISEILGERVNPEIAHNVKKTIMSFPEVHGVYDMVFHDYGPTMVFGSVHIQVDENMRAPEISELIRRISLEVFEIHQVVITAISIYSLSASNENAIEIQETATEIAMSHEHVIQIHGFYILNNVIQFDVIVDFDAPNRLEICDQIAEEVHKKYPEFAVQAILDADYGFSE